MKREKGDEKEIEGEEREKRKVKKVKGYFSPFINI
jgi:hypothetical protein